MNKLARLIKECCRCHLNMAAVLLSVFFLTSCFPEDNTQQTGSVEQQLQVQQSTAVSYARMFQQYAALSQQYLMKDVWEDGVVELPADGIIGSQMFANLYNVAKASEFLESAHCYMGANNEYHISWFKGDVILGDNTKGGGAGTVASVIPKDLKGIGKGGYGGIMKVMSREMSPRSYGVYDGQNVKLGDGTSRPITCDAMQYIPAGTPVILSSVKKNTSESVREYYVYNSEPCGGEEAGIIRTRVKMSQAYDENGEPLDGQGPVQIGEVEELVRACQTNPGTPAISIAASQADVVDFASAGLLGTMSANCFEATQVDANGRPVVDEQGNEIKFSNCDTSEHNYNPDNLPPGRELLCDTTALPHNSSDPRMETVRACTGEGWTGNAIYRREIYRCEVMDVTSGTRVPTGVFYEEAREWRNHSIHCERPEETYLFCPYSDGTLRYDRTNIINTFTEGTFNPGPPRNPDWVYASGTCDVNVRNCSPRYLGQDSVADNTMPGSLERRPATNPHNMPGAEIRPISTLCGTGDVCVERQEGMACPVDNMTGTRTEERTYTCSGTNSGAWSHPAAPAPWLEVANNCNCTIWAQSQYGRQCAASADDFTPVCPEDTTSGYAGSLATPGATCPTVGATCNNVSPIPDQGSACSEGQSPFEAQTLVCSNFTDPAACGCTEQVETRVSGQPGAPVCSGGQDGVITQKRVRSCPSGDWSSWETISNTCTCEGPYARDVPAGACPPGQTGALPHPILDHQIKDPVTCAWTTTSTTNTCTSCGTESYQWVRQYHHSTCTRPGTNDCQGQPVSYLEPAMCPFGYGVGGGACDTPGLRCSTQAEWLDAGSCPSCRMHGVIYISSYFYDVWECAQTTGAACCVPYSEEVSQNSNVCPAGESGRSSITYNDYDCNTTTNQQTGPTVRTEYFGTCSPDALPPVCTPGEQQNVNLGSPPVDHCQMCEANGQWGTPQPGACSVGGGGGDQTCDRCNGGIGWCGDPNCNECLVMRPVECNEPTQCEHAGIYYNPGSIRFANISCTVGTGTIQGGYECQSNGLWGPFQESPGGNHCMCPSYNWEFTGTTQQCNAGGGSQYQPIFGTCGALGSCSSGQAGDTCYTSRQEDIGAGCEEGLGPVNRVNVLEHYRCTEQQVPCP